MKKIIILTIGIILLISVFSGCVGPITGHQYKLEDAKIIYQVTKDGVTTFMTEEEIKEKGLDKTNALVTKWYKTVEESKEIQEDQKDQEKK